MRLPSLEEAVAHAVPRRLSPRQREELVARVVNDVSRWREAAPRVATGKRRQRDLVPVADRLRRALEKITAEMERRLPVRKEFEAALGSMVPHSRLEGRSAVVDLYLAACAALLRLEQWNACYRPKARRPRKAAVDLAELIRIHCDGPSVGDLTEKEYAAIIEAVNSTEAQSALSVETVRTRRQRSRVKVARKSG